MAQPGGGAGRPRLAERPPAFVGWAMLRWLRGFVLPGVACQEDEDDFSFGILFQDLDRDGNGLVDIVELQEGLKNWGFSFDQNSEKVSDQGNVAPGVLGRRRAEGEAILALCKAFFPSRVGRVGFFSVSAPSHPSRRILPPSPTKSVLSHFTTVTFHHGQSLLCTGRC